MDKQKEYGIQECSKCEYKLRCEECVYNEKDISELIKFEKQQASKETAEKFAKELLNRKQLIDLGCGDGTYDFVDTDDVVEVAKDLFGIEIKE